jgi:muramidase (phage lysozyme)
MWYKQAINAGSIATTYKLESRWKGLQLGLEQSDMQQPLTNLRAKYRCYQHAHISQVQLLLTS